MGLWSKSLILWSGSFYALLTISIFGCDIFLVYERALVLAINSVSAFLFPQSVICSSVFFFFFGGSSSVHVPLSPGYIVAYAAELHFSFKRYQFITQLIVLLSIACTPGASQVVLVVKNPLASAGDARERYRFDPWVGKILWRREWQPTPVFLLGESHGQRSLVGNSPWRCKESATAEMT